MDFSKFKITMKLLLINAELKNVFWMESEWGFLCFSWLSNCLFNEWIKFIFSWGWRQKLPAQIGKERAIRLIAIANLTFGQGIIFNIFIGINVTDKNYYGKLEKLWIISGSWEQRDKKLVSSREKVLEDQDWKFQGLMIN